MNIKQEKENIFSIIQNLTSERRKLTEERMELTREISDWKNRLNQLINLEERGLDNLKIDGYIELYNRRNNETEILNKKRELQEELNKLQDNIIEEKKDIIEEIIPTKEKEEFKDKIKFKSSGKLDLDKVGPLIINILKENGIPLKSKRLHSLLEEKLGTSVKYKNFSNNIMPRVIIKFPKVERITRGTYQYRL